MRNIKSPRFQQRHYEWLAEVIRNHTRDRIAALALCEILIGPLKSDNPKFSPEMFREACIRPNQTH